MRSAPIGRLWTEVLFSFLVSFLVVSDARAGPHDWAIVIGNKSYGNELPEVTFAHNDLAAVAKAATDVFRIPKSNVVSVKDAGLGKFFELFGNSRMQAPRPPSKLEQLIRRETKRIIVYYSGHGVPHIAEGRVSPYLLPVRADPLAVALSGYSIEDFILSIRTAVENKAPQAEVLIIIDACFSGTSDGGSLMPDTSKGPFKPNFDMQPHHGVIVLRATSSTDVAHWDRYRKHGLFTDALLSGLYGAADVEHGGNGDRIITLKELHNYTTKRMDARLKLLHPTRTVIQVPSFPELDKVALVRLEGTIPDRDAPLRKQEEGQCRYLLQFPDQAGAAEIDSFLRSCSVCPCRDELERHRDRLSSRPSSCSSDQAAWDMIRRTGDLARVEWMLGVTQCPQIRGEAQAMLDEAKRKRDQDEAQREALRKEMQRRQDEDKRLAERGQQLKEEMDRIAEERRMLEEERNRLRRAKEQVVEEQPKKQPEVGGYIYRPVGQSTLTSESMWEHNGSTIRLVRQGAVVRLHYLSPRQGMIEEGVRQGTLLFEGRFDGSTIIGTAYIFSGACRGSYPYQVTGSASESSRSFTLAGHATRLDRRCRPAGTRPDSLTFSLQ